MLNVETNHPLQLNRVDVVILAHVMQDAAAFSSVQLGKNSYLTLDFTINALDLRKHLVLVRDARLATVV